MSRLSSLSSSAIRAMFSSETDETLIMLLTIYNPADNSVAVRLADNFTGRLTNITTDTEVYYGVTSRSHDYVFLPMQINLPSETETGGDSCSLTLNYVTREAVELIRTQLNKPTKILLELVLSNSPNTVEAAFPSFYITSATYSAEQIRLDLNMISYNREPFPSYNFTPSYFPGLF